MPTYERFIFESFELNRATRQIHLDYSLDGKVNFRETITLPQEGELNLEHPDLPYALFALHLAGGASYYKTYCPKIIEIKSGALTQEQADFWNVLYTRGLGEFFFQNQIDFRGLIKFPAHPAQAPTPRSPAPLRQRPKHALVALGGGKDSLVTVELLRKADVDQTLFRLRPHRLITELAAQAQAPLITLDRALAPKLFELNEAGAMNGHVPITAYITFLSVIASLMTHHDAVVFSNERSSSYGNVEYLGMTINHQWSKSREAEEALRYYINHYVTPGTHVLNLLQPLSELHIAKLFAGEPQYFHSATSCNRNWLLAASDKHTDIWCGVCPKCAFTFALMTAWLPAERVLGMFGHNLFEDTSLRPLYRQLWGIEGFKPFECVGTPEEARAAFYLASHKPQFAHTPLMDDFNRDVLPTIENPDKLVRRLLKPQFDLASPMSAELLRDAGVTGAKPLLGGQP